MLHSFLVKTKKFFSVCVVILFLFSFKKNEDANSWIRINQLGYTPGGIKAAVWVSKNNELPKDFQLINAADSKVVFTSSTGKSFGKYGPFNESCRLNFSSYKTPGNFYLKCGSAISPKFKIDESWGSCCTAISAVNDILYFDNLPYLTLTTYE